MSRIRMSFYRKSKESLDNLRKQAESDAEKDLISQIQFWLRLHSERLGVIEDENQESN